MDGDGSDGSDGSDGGEMNKVGVKSARGEL